MLSWICNTINTSVSTALVTQIPLTVGRAAHDQQQHNTRPDLNYTWLSMCVSLVVIVFSGASPNRVLLCYASDIQLRYFLQLAQKDIHNPCQTVWAQWSANIKQIKRAYYSWFIQNHPTFCLFILLPNMPSCLHLSQTTPSN